MDRGEAMPMVAASRSAASWDARDGAHEALARDGREHGIAHRDHLAGGALDHDVLVSDLVEARAGVDADAVVATPARMSVRA